MSKLREGQQVPQDTGIATLFREWEPGITSHAHNVSTWRQRQKGCQIFETSPVYKVSSRPAGATQEHHQRKKKAKDESWTKVCWCAKLCSRLWTMLSLSGTLWWNNPAAPLLIQDLDEIRSGLFHYQLAAVLQRHWGPWNENLIHGLTRKILLPWTRHLTANSSEHGHGQSPVQVEGSKNWLVVVSLANNTSRCCELEVFKGPTTALICF